MPPSGQSPRERTSSDMAQIWREAARLTLVAIASWVAVWVGLVFTVRPGGGAAIWPASGLALAVLLLSERRRWIPLLLVIFIVNVAGNLSGGDPLPVSLGFALANSAGAAAGAWVMARCCGPKITFTHLVEVLTLCGVAVFSSGIAALLSAALAFGAPFFDAWSVRWASDVLGIMLVAPVIVAWATRPNVLQTAPRRRLAEGAVFIAAILTLAWLTYGPFTIAERPVLRNYMVFPFLIWAAFRFGLRGTTTALWAFAAIAAWNTVQSYGVFGFANLPLQERLLSVQAFLGVATLSGLLLAAMVAERVRAEEVRRQAEAALRESETWFRAIYDCQQNGMVVIDPETHTITSANIAMLDMIGASGEEVIGKECYTFICPAEKGRCPVTDLGQCVDHSERILVTHQFP